MIISRTKRVFKWNKKHFSLLLKCSLLDMQSKLAKMKRTQPLIWIHSMLGWRVTEKARGVTEKKTKMKSIHQRVAYYLWTYVFDMACYSSTLNCRDETFFGKKTSYPSPPILRNFNDVPLIPFNLNPVPGTEGCWPKIFKKKLSWCPFLTFLTFSLSNIF